MLSCGIAGALFFLSALSFAADGKDVIINKTPLNLAETDFQIQVTYYIGPDNVVHSNWDSHEIQNFIDDYDAAAKLPAGVDAANAHGRMSPQTVATVLAGYNALGRSSNRICVYACNQILDGSGPTSSASQLAAGSPVGTTTYGLNDGKGHQATMRVTKLPCGAIHVELFGADGKTYLDPATALSIYRRTKSGVKERPFGRAGVNYAKGRGFTFPTPGTTRPPEGVQATSNTFPHLDKVLCPLPLSNTPASSVSGVNLSPEGAPAPRPAGTLRGKPAVAAASAPIPLRNQLPGLGIGIANIAGNTAINLWAQQNEDSPGAYYINTAAADTEAFRQATLTGVNSEGKPYTWWERLMFSMAYCHDTQSITGSW